MVNAYMGVSVGKNKNVYKNGTVWQRQQRLCLFTNKVIIPQI